MTIGNSIKLFIIVNLAVTSVQCANILVIDPLPSPSHQIWISTLAKAIGTQHNVTYITIGTEKNLGSNVTNILLEEVFNELDRGMPPSDIVAWHNKHPIEEIFEFGAFCRFTCHGAFKSKGLQTILNYPKDFRFDLIVYDISCGPCVLSVATKFKTAPIVGLSPFGMLPYIVETLGGHIPHAYIPYYGLYYSDDMNFWERSYNMFMFLTHNAIHYTMFYPDQDSIARKYMGNDLPYLPDYQKNNMVLGLLNTHPGADFPFPLPPSSIPVGGLQIQSPKMLPKDLEEFIQNSQKGAVLFSLGTNIRSDTIGTENQIELIKALGEMPQYNFLWKFESDTLPVKLPKNVIVRPFLPQTDILAHPNVKAFISHGGQLSTLESTWYGKPMIIIPFLGDQHRNAHNLAKFGVAESVPFSRLSRKEVKEKVLAVLGNPKYRDNMIIRSKRFRDQPEKPIDRAMWWINYVLRHPNPVHLESPVKRLGFFVANSYDVLFAFVGAVLGIFYVLCKLLCFCLRRKSQKKVKKH